MIREGNKLGGNPGRRTPKRKGEGSRTEQVQVRMAADGPAGGKTGQGVAVHHWRGLTNRMGPTVLICETHLGGTFGGDVRAKL